MTKEGITPLKTAATAGNIEIVNGNKIDNNSINSYPLQQQQQQQQHLKIHLKLDHKHECEP